VRVPLNTVLMGLESLLTFAGPPKRTLQRIPLSPLSNASVPTMGSLSPSLRPAGSVTEDTGKALTDRADAMPAGPEKAASLSLRVVTPNGGQTAGGSQQSATGTPAHWRPTSTAVLPALHAAVSSLSAGLQQLQRPTGCATPRGQQLSAGDRGDAALQRPNANGGVFGAAAGGVEPGAGASRAAHSWASAGTGGTPMHSARAAPGQACSSHEEADSSVTQQVLCDAEEAADAEEFSETLRLVYSSAKNIHKILDDFLSLEKIEAGKMSLEPAPFPLSQLLRPTLSAFMVPANRKRIQLLLAVERGVRDVVTGDLHRLRQVLSNLISNALKFSSMGGSIIVHVSEVVVSGDVCYPQQIVGGSSEHLGSGVHASSVSLQGGSADAGSRARMESGVQAINEGSYGVTQGSSEEGARLEGDGIVQEPGDAHTAFESWFPTFLPLNPSMLQAGAAHLRAQHTHHDAGTSLSAVVASSESTAVIASVAVPPARSATVDGEAATPQGRRDARSDPERAKPLENGASRLIAGMLQRRGISPDPSSVLVFAVNAQADGIELITTRRSKSTARSTAGASSVSTGSDGLGRSPRRSPPNTAHGRQPKAVSGGEKRAGTGVIAGLLNSLAAPSPRHRPSTAKPAEPARPHNGALKEAFDLRDALAAQQLRGHAASGATIQAWPGAGDPEQTRLRPTTEPPVSPPVSSAIPPNGVFPERSDDPASYISLGVSSSHMDTLRASEPIRNPVPALELLSSRKTSGLPLGAAQHAPYEPAHDPQHSDPSAPSGGAAFCSDRVRMLRIAVIDEGVGISEEEQHLLFKPFNQIRAGAVQKGNGTGLGLAICKRIVELSGGQIGVTSAVGRGSTFWFQVPMCVAQQVRSSSDSAPPALLIATSPEPSSMGAQGVAPAAGAFLQAAPAVLAASTLPTDGTWGPASGQIRAHLAGVSLGPWQPATGSLSLPYEPAGPVAAMPPVGAAGMLRAAAPWEAAGAASSQDVLSGSAGSLHGRTPRLHADVQTRTPPPTGVSGAPYQLPLQHSSRQTPAAASPRQLNGPQEMLAATPRTVVPRGQLAVAPGAEMGTGGGQPSPYAAYLQQQLLLQHGRGFDTLQQGVVMSAVGPLGGPLGRSQLSPRSLPSPQSLAIPMRAGHVHSMLANIAEEPGEVDGSSSSSSVNNAVHHSVSYSSSRAGSSVEFGDSARVRPDPMRVAADAWTLAAGVPAALLVRVQQNRGPRRVGHLTLTQTARAEASGLAPKAALVLPQRLPGAPDSASPMNAGHFAAATPRGGNQSSLVREAPSSPLAPSPTGTAVGSAGSRKGGEATSNSSPTASCSAGAPAHPQSSRKPAHRSRNRSSARRKHGRSSVDSPHAARSSTRHSEDGTESVEGTSVVPTALPSSFLAPPPTVVAGQSSAGRGSLLPQGEFSSAATGPLEQRIDEMHTLQHASSAVAVSSHPHRFTDGSMPLASFLPPIRPPPQHQQLSPPQEPASSLVQSAPAMFTPVDSAEAGGGRPQTAAPSWLGFVAPGPQVRSHEQGSIVSVLQGLPPGYRLVGTGPAGALPRGGGYLHVVKDGIVQLFPMASQHELGGPGSVAPAMPIEPLLPPPAYPDGSAHAFSPGALGHYAMASAYPGGGGHADARFGSGHVSLMRTSSTATTNAAHALEWERQRQAGAPQPAYADYAPPSDLLRRAGSATGEVHPAPVWMHTEAFPPQNMLPHPGHAALVQGPVHGSVLPSPHMPPQHMHVLAPAAGPQYGSQYSTDGGAAERGSTRLATGSDDFAFGGAGGPRRATEDTPQVYRVHASAHHSGSSVGYPSMPATPRVPSLASTPHCAGKVETSAASAGPSLLPAHRRLRRAVVIDDVKSNRDLFARLLKRRLGVELIHVCESGHRAITLAQSMASNEERDSFVWFTDKEMPGVVRCACSSLRSRGRVSVPHALSTTGVYPSCAPFMPLRTESCRMDTPWLVRYGKWV